MSDRAKSGGKSRSLSAARAGLHPSFGRGVGWLACLFLAAPLAWAQQPRTVTQLEFGQVYGYANADFNNDGLIDYFATGHDPDHEQIWYTQPDRSFAPGWLFPGRNPNGGQIDRHGCTVADFNMDGRLDLFCAHGASKGEGRGSNERWLQNADGTFTRDNETNGATDPYGRGRHPVAFKFDQGPTPDLYLTNDGEPRADGRPNLNHVYTNDGTGHFTEVITKATVPLQTTCQGKGDVNHDGFDDLYACPRDSDALIYVNNGKLDFDLLALPMADKLWWDARLTRINEDAKDDLVVSTHSGHVQVFLNTGNRKAPFKAIPDFDAVLPNPNGVSLAIGDLNGDGTPDIYVVMRQVVSFDGPDCVGGQDTVDDVVFMSKGSAKKGWQMVQLVQGYAGCGYEAEYIGQQRVSLSQGGTGWNGPGYVLDWREPLAAKQPKAQK